MSTWKNLSIAIALTATAGLVLSACSDDKKNSARTYVAPITVTASAQPEQIDRLGGKPTDIEQDPSKMKKREILRDSESYKYLSAPQQIEPGARYYVDSKEGVGSCSFGWTVREEGKPEQLYNLTAGHCGDVGDKVYIDPVGKENPDDMIQVGEFVWRSYDGDKAPTEGGDDYALIGFLDGTREVMTGTPNLTLFGEDHKVELVGWQDAAWLNENQPYMCRLGWRSGITCGGFQEITNDTNVSFDGITDHGDSGGVVWAFDPKDETMSTIYAVAVASWVDFGGDAATTNGKTIDKPMEGLKLQVVK